MSVARDRLIAVLSPPLPSDIISALLDEYQHIKSQYFLRRYRPSELNAGRFSECVLRLIEFLDTRHYTPLGTHLQHTDAIVNRVINNTAQPQAIRFFIPRLARILLDIRNKRDVAHVGGEVSPNQSDSLLVCHCADWILTELVRNYHGCSIDEASQIVTAINETRVPLVAEINGFIKVQNAKLDARQKTLVILYYKNPTPVSDINLIKWLRYGNASRYRTDILQPLDKEALIHYEQGICTLLPRGVGYVESHISLEILI